MTMLAKAWLRLRQLPGRLRQWWRAGDPVAHPAGYRQGFVRCLNSQGLHRMAYTEWGDPANPHVVVCVHGLTRNGRDFDELARALAPYCRVICRTWWDGGQVTGSRINRLTDFLSTLQTW